MFKIIITDSVYQDIIRTEEQRPLSGRSYLYQLLMQQPVQQLSAEQTEKLRQHPEEVLKNPSALYILQISHTEALAIQKYGTQGQVSVPLLQHIVCPLVVRNSIEKFGNMENSSYLCSEDK